MLQKNHPKKLGAASWAPRNTEGGQLISPLTKPVSLTQTRYSCCVPTLVSSHHEDYQNALHFYPGGAGGGRIFSGGKVKIRVQHPPPTTKVLGKPWGRGIILSSADDASRKKSANGLENAESVGESERRVNLCPLKPGILLVEVSHDRWLIQSGILS